MGNARRGCVERDGENLIQCSRAEFVNASFGADSGDNFVHFKRPSCYQSVCYGLKHKKLIESDVDWVLCVVRF